LKYVSEFAGLEMMLEDNAVKLIAKQDSALRMETVLSPAKAAHQYDVVLMVPKIPGSEANLLPAQKMTVTAGQEGKVEMLDKDGRNGTVYKALVTESNNAPSEIITSVVVLENGKEALSSKQTIRLKR
jgi:hypothetical protein